MVSRETKWRLTLLAAGVCLLWALGWPRTPQWASFAPRSEPPPPPATTSAEPTVGEPIDRDELRGFLQRVTADRFSTGVAVAVVHDGELILAEGFGFADLDRETPMTADTVFRVGSLSKGMLSLALVDLEAKGRLHLDDPVRRHLPEIRIDNRWEDTDPVRVTHLLEHTSGFDEMHFNEMVADDDEADWPMRDVLAINPRSRRVRWRPGTRHAYSHPGYTVAGAVVEALTGQRFDAHVESTILQPLGLEVASFRYTAAVADRLAPAYWNDGSRIPHRHLHHRPGSSLYISAAELARYLQMLANRGVVDGRRVMPQAHIERAENGSTLPYPGLRPSYGLGNYSGHGEGVRSQGHGGWMPGYDSTLRYYPEQRSGFVLLTNEPVNHQAVWVVDNRLRQMLARGVPREPVPPPTELSPEQLDHFVGTYRFRSPSASLMEAFMPNPTRRVFRRGNGLAMRGWDVRGLDIIATDERTFRYPGQTHGSKRFDVSPDGTAILFDANGFSYFERCSTLGSVLIDTCFIAATILLYGALLAPALWIPLLAMGREVEAPWLRALPSLGAWSLFLMTRALFGAPVYELGHVNTRTVVVFLLSWGFTVLTVASLVTSARHLRRPQTSDSSLVIRVCALLASLALATWAIQLATHGLIGLRTWVW